MRITNHMKYIIYFEGELEVEAEDQDRAKEEAGKRFDEMKDLKITKAKVADKASGYFI